MENFFFDNWYGIPILVFLALIICIVAFAPVLWYECQVNSELMDIDVEWRFIGGCFVQLSDGTYVNMDVYRTMRILEEPND
jgi:hypothetical protein